MHDHWCTQSCHVGYYVFLQITHDKSLYVTGYTYTVKYLCICYGFFDITTIRIRTFYAGIQYIDQSWIATSYYVAHSKILLYMYDVHTIGLQNVYSLKLMMAVSPSVLRWFFIGAYHTFEFVLDGHLCWMYIFVAVLTHHSYLEILMEHCLKHHIRPHAIMHYKIQTKIHEISDRQGISLRIKPWKSSICAIHKIYMTQKFVCVWDALTYVLKPR